MKRSGILNAQLNALISRLGHTDYFVVADCGLPVPKDVPIVDLAVTFGLPRLPDVLPILLNEIEVERVVLASGTPQEVRDLLPQVPAEEITHEELKARLPQASFVIRTGDNTPYSNVIFQSGVPF